MVNIQNQSKTVSSSYSTLTTPVPLDIQASATFIPSQPQGQGSLLNFVSDPTQPSVVTTSLQVPSDEYWVIYSVYSPIQTPAVDGVITFSINRKPQNITFGPLSLTYRNVFGYIDFTSSLMIPPNGLLSGYLVPAVANGTTTATDTVNIRVLRVPQGYQGQLPI
jgi:hypothetical protein